jgi:hypothetical protein
MFHPLPIRPHPHGGDSPSIQFQGREPLSAVNVKTLPKSCLYPLARPPVLSPINCPPPRKGAGGGAERAGRWGWSMNTVQSETHETGAGDVPPPSPSAPPPRGDIPSMHCRGRASPRLDVNTLPKSCLRPRTRLSGTIAKHSPAPGQMLSKARVVARPSTPARLPPHHRHP